MHPKAVLTLTPSAQRVDSSLSAGVPILSQAQRQPSVAVVSIYIRASWFELQLFFTKMLTLLSFLQVQLANMLFGAEKEIKTKTKKIATESLLITLKVYQMVE
jgi:hypothetical protein